MCASTRHARTDHVIQLVAALVSDRTTCYPTGYHGRGVTIPHRRSDWQEKWIIERTNQTVAIERRIQTTWGVGVWRRGVNSAERLTQIYRAGVANVLAAGVGESGPIREHNVTAHSSRLRHISCSFKRGLWNVSVVSCDEAQRKSHSRHRLPTMVSKHGCQARLPSTVVKHSRLCVGGGRTAL
jgi:hypothetical protein